MVVTIGSTDAATIAAALVARTPGRLTYALELQVETNVTFAPFETKILDTRLRARPRVPCLLFCSKIASATAPPHAVDYLAVLRREPEPSAEHDDDEDELDPDSERTISLRVSNPTSKPLPPQRETPLRLLLFALPLSPVRLDLLWIQRRAEDPRYRPRSPISILSAIPGPHSLDLELVTTNLVWKPYARDRRLTTTIALDMFRADIRRYTTAEVKTCTQENVYGEQITTIQTSGNAYVSLLTKTEARSSASSSSAAAVLEGRSACAAPPSALALRLVFRQETEETAAQKRVAFTTYPDPTYCTPHGYGLEIAAPRNVHLFPDYQSRVDISVSFCSDGAYLGFFVPTPRKGVSCQLVAWPERQSLSLLMLSSEPVDVRRGELLGHAYFLPSDTLRIRRISTPTAITKCTALLALGSAAVKTESPGPKRRAGPGPGDDEQGADASDGPVWTAYAATTTREQRAKRKRSPQRERETATSRARNPSASSHSSDLFSEDDDTVEIYPSGAVFNLRRLVPLMLQSTPRRGPLKKISPIAPLKTSAVRWSSEP